MITARNLFIHIHFYLLNTPNRHSVVIEATQGLSFVIYFYFSFLHSMIPEIGIRLYLEQMCLVSLIKSALKGQL